MRVIRMLALALASSLAIDPVQAETFTIPDLIKGFAVTVTATCDAWECEGPARIRLTAKGKNASQILRIPDIASQLSKTGDFPYSTDASSHQDENAIVADDFNFDGFTDIALRTERNAAYGLPSYDIYLQDPCSRRFLKSEELTELATGKMGLFYVDKAGKSLIVYERSGYAWWLTSRYGSGPGRNLTLLSSEEVDVSPDGKHARVTTYSSSSRKRETRVVSCPADDYC